MNRVCVIDMPGLSRDLMRHIPARTALGRWLHTQPVADLVPTWPAVTCSVQASLTTGTTPSEHGIIANGIATFRSEADREKIDYSNFASYRRNVSFWEQSNQFLDRPRFWQNADGTSRYKTALLFFQNSMPGFARTPRPAADIVLTPKPDHGPDGKLTSLCWSNPPNLVPELFKEFGPFPLMNYWGPMAGIASSQWIAKAAARVWETEAPTLQFTYVPHLDYDLQRFGPDSSKAVQAVIDIAGALEPLFKAIGTSGRIIVLSEYSIQAVHRSIQPNRILKQAGLLQIRDGEIDYKCSRAFAMVDHQVGYLYSIDPAAWQCMEGAGIIEVPVEIRPAHRRAGDRCMQAPSGCWFDYRWWDEKTEDGPTYSTTVDIHRKPGYDPLELFLKPGTRSIAKDSGLIKGSHGQTEASGVLAGIQNDASNASSIATMIDKLITQ